MYLDINPKCISFLRVRSRIKDLPSMSPLFYQIEDFSDLKKVTTIMTAPNLQSKTTEFIISKQPLLENLVIQKGSFAGVGKFILADLPSLRYIYIGENCFNCEIGKDYVMKITNCGMLSILYISRSAMNNYHRIELESKDLVGLFYTRNTLFGM